MCTLCSLHCRCRTPAVFIIFKYWLWLALNYHFNLREWIWWTIYEQILLAQSLFQCRSHANDQSLFSNLCHYELFLVLFYFIYATVYVFWCFSLLLSLPHSRSSVDFSKRKIQPTTSKICNFFFQNVATAVAVGDGGRWRFGKFTFNWVLFGGMVMRGRKVLCKLIWLNAKIGHALKKDESEMKCCSPSQCVYTLARERDRMLWSNVGSILRAQKPKRIVEIFQVVT